MSARRPAVPGLPTERLEAPLAPLDRLPRGLWLSSLTHSHGALAPRLAGVERLRAGLLRGEAPDGTGTWAWPEPALARGLAATFADLDLARHCRADEAVADHVVRSHLWHLDRIPDAVDRGRSPAEAEAAALADFADDWRERCGELDELVDVLGGLGDLAKSERWDLLRGLLRSAGWQEVVRIRRLLERLPALVEVVRRLGRARETDEPEAARQVEATVAVETTEARPEWRESRVPDLPGETRGVRRSGRIARMLPAEALLLRHPRLRLVWHARHAERTLLTYEDDDRLEEQVLRRRKVWHTGPGLETARKLAFGPMLVCVDTSGSMQGGAEAVAKAVVLEAARSAAAQGRACHVFAFSGPGEVVDLELGADLGGLERLTRFLAQGFGGGTDIGAPLERALGLLEEEAWQLADLLLASDGEFGATREVAAAVAAAKERRGLRVQGVLVGDRETIGLLELCDDVFWVRDWRRYGGGEAGSPVHSSALTRLYFPEALRSPEVRERTVEAGEASREVLRPGSLGRGGQEP